jgi:hypothetical protein
MVERLAANIGAQITILVVAVELNCAQPKGKGLGDLRREAAFRQRGQVFVLATSQGLDESLSHASCAQA